MAHIGTQSDFLANFIDSHKVPEDALKHFSAQPWLQPYLSNPEYKAIPTFASLLFPDESTRIGILRRAVCGLPQLPQRPSTYNLQRVFDYPVCSSKFQSGYTNLSYSPEYSKTLGKTSSLLAPLLPKRRFLIWSPSNSSTFPLQQKLHAAQNFQRKTSRTQQKYRSSRTAYSS